MKFKETHNHLRRIASGIILPSVLILPLLASCGSPEGATTNDTTAGNDSGTSYPEDDITLVIPYGAGGDSDVIGRSLAQYFQNELGVTVVPENRDGASGTIGMNYLANSEPDGYTIGLMLKGPNVLGPMVLDPGYGAEDIQPVGMIADVPTALVVTNESAFENIDDLLEAAEDNPSSVTVGTAGANAPTQITVERLAQGPNGVQFQPIPFNANSESTAALIGGNVDAISINLSKETLARIDSGEMRALAVSTPERLPYLPDVPTLRESGFEDVVYGSSFYGLGVPTGTPAPVVEKLENTLKSALNDEDVRTAIGENYIPEEFVGGEELQQRIEEMRAVYEPLMQNK